jgi:hypothetical protein
MVRFRIGGGDPLNGHTLLRRDGRVTEMVVTGGLMRDLSKYPMTDEEIIDGLQQMIAGFAAEPMPGDMRTTFLRAALERIRRYPTAPERIGENGRFAESARPQSEVEREAKALIRRRGLSFQDAIRVLMQRRMGDHDRALRMTGREGDPGRLMFHVAEEASEGRVPETVAFALRAAGIDPAGPAVTDEFLAALLRSGGSWPHESLMRAARRLVEEEAGHKSGVGSAPPP